MYLTPMRIFFSAILVCLSMFAMSQSKKDSCTFVVRGQILDLQTKEPLPFAEVRIENSTRGAVTDEKGFFTIDNVCDKEVHLIVSFVGYKTTIHHHDLHHPNPKIFLAPDQVMLESVIIEAEHERRY
ncbi:MAG: carboxypeptidase-like regulatory domain-containing protein [Flammeovirgaceae bacterium]|nr:carboxypeptidase-like regulatory domain-containing protein [Flammeovirgaceae bacterium]